MNEEQPRKDTVIKHEYDGIEYSINEKEKTASVIGSTTAISGNFFIPRSIIYEKTEYLVTNISENAFMNSEELISIQFAPISEMKVIKKNAFSNSKIEKLSIPANLIELEEGWCYNTQKLTQVEVSSENKRFTVYKDKFILKKSSEEKENFDILVFACRDITKARIPSFIEIIGSHAFNYCIHLELVEFSKDSKLRIIEDGSFSNTNIKRIDVPNHVTKICSNAFNYSGLQHIEIPPNSELQTIEKHSFSYSYIEKIVITPNIIELDDEWCSFTNKLNEFTILPNNKRYVSYENKFIFGKSTLENENYDVLVFAVRDIEEAIIPSFIKIIAPYAFSECKKFQTIEFSEDSELRIISNHAFYSSSLRKINIPSHVTRINESAFEGCFHLQEINIPTNSELLVIEENAFFDTNINSLFIPSKLTDLNEKWGICLKSLNKITVAPDNNRYATYEDKYIIGKSTPENELYDVLVFCVIDIQIAVIPDFIKIIGPFAFCNCYQLQQVITTENSQLQIIDNNAFESSSIQRINVPQGLTKIGEFAFLQCEMLQEVIIPENCQLEEISKSAFENSNLQSIVIPSQVQMLKESAFLGCSNLHEIQIQKESKLKIIEKNAFFGTSLDSIYIPSNIIELKEGWCNGLHNIITFTIASQLFKSYEDKYIIGKSNQEKEEFDVLVLSMRNIEKAIIPNFIKIIGPNSFDNCKNLKKFEIEKDSKLETIDSSAFIESSIEKITIPYHVKYLKQRAFFYNQKLKKVEIPSNSQIKIIEPKTFAYTDIQSITIPQNVVTISQTAFSNCQHLQIIEIEGNSQMKYIHHNMFVDCTQIKIMIPQNLSNCLFLNK